MRAAVTEELPLTPAEVNHLRRLIGWVACEIGQSPDEMVATVRDIAAVIGGDVGEDAKSSLVAAHQKSANVPQYVRAAITSLRKSLERRPDGIESVEVVERQQAALPPPDPHPAQHRP